MCSAHPYALRKQEAVHNALVHLLDFMPSWYKRMCSMKVSQCHV